MKKLGTFFIALTVFFSGAGFLQAKMSDVPEGHMLSVEFVQQRSLKGVPKPLISSGKMYLYKDKGLVWKTEKPFPNTLVISKSGIYALDKKVKNQLVKAGGESAVFDAMVGIFNVSEGQEIEGFKLEIIPAEPNVTRFKLTPKNSRVQNFIQSITLEGQSYVSKIIIVRPNGDRDEIRLSLHKISKPTSIEVERYFAN